MRNIGFYIVSPIGKVLINGLKPEGYSKSVLVLNHPIGSIFHNPQDYAQPRPYTWFHRSEWPNYESGDSVKNQILNNIDYTFSGHLDYSENVVVDPIGRTIRLLDGKYYLNRSVGYGYLCRLVSVGRYTNTIYRNLTTTSSKYDKNWSIGLPTPVSGESDSPLKLFGDFFPLFIEIDNLSRRGEIAYATEICMRYFFSKQAVNINSLNLSDEWDNLLYQLNNLFRTNSQQKEEIYGEMIHNQGSDTASSSNSNAEESFAKNGMDGR